jgi:hypothetical protein
MSWSTDGVRCTVRDGAMWMHLDDLTVQIPPQLLNTSQVLMKAMSVARSSVARKVTLAAPQRWLQAWVGCFCIEEEILSDQDTQSLVDCLLVCLLSLECGCNRADISQFCVHSRSCRCLAHFTACRVLGAMRLHCPTS